MQFVKFFRRGGDLYALDDSGRLYEQHRGDWRWIQEATRLSVLISEDLGNVENPDGDQLDRRHRLIGRILRFPVAIKEVIKDRFEFILITALIVLGITLAAALVILISCEQQRMGTPISIPDTIELQSNGLVIGRYKLQNIPKDVEVQGRQLRVTVKDVGGKVK